MRVNESQAFLAYVWLISGTSLTVFLFFEQLAFVCHSVALILCVISSCLNICIYAIEVLCTLSILHIFFSFIFLFFSFFDNLTLLLPFRFSLIHLSDPNFIPFPSVITPVFPVLLSLLSLLFMRNSFWPFPRPCYITAPLWCFVSLESSPLSVWWYATVSELNVLRPTVQPD